MNLVIVNRSRSVIAKSFLKFWIKRLVKYVPELGPYAELTLVFVSSAEMKKLNRQYRGKDYATDVLSFEPVDFLNLDKKSKKGKKPKDNLGELVFCLSVIKRQAKVHGLTFEQELGYMIVHGVLHLLGYEHEAGGAKAKKMYALQDDTFAKMLK